VSAGKVRTTLDLYIENMKWGLIPSYHSMNDRIDHWKMFNNRVDQLFAADSYFQKLAKSVENRAVFVITGFYEWQIVAGKKTPHYIYLADGQTMNIAMLVDK
jgi:putative SOS response-associated peptidase YedK